MRQIRFFGGLMGSQERWLNQKAREGWRLERTGRLSYDFAACQPGKYQYCVEYIGNLSWEHALDYRKFLEGCGYRVLEKSINANWSTGKVVWRPWAEKGGEIATSGTTLNRELLIVEKEADGKPFALHTSYEDRQRYYRQLQKPCLAGLLLGLALGLIQKTLLWGIFAAIAAAMLLTLQRERNRLQKQAAIEEE